MKKKIFIAGLCGSVLLAGCSGASGGNTETTAKTDANMVSVNATIEDADAKISFQIPKGWEADKENTNNIEQYKGLTYHTKHGDNYMEVSYYEFDADNWVNRLTTGDDIVDTPVINRVDIDGIQATYTSFTYTDDDFGDITNYIYVIPLDDKKLINITLMDTDDTTADVENFKKVVDSVVILK